MCVITQHINTPVTCSSADSISLVCICRESACDLTSGAPDLPMPSISGAGAAQHHPADQAMLRGLPSMRFPHPEAPVSSSRALQQGTGHRAQKSCGPPAPQVRGTPLCALGLSVGRGAHPSKPPMLLLYPIPSPNWEGERREPLWMGTYACTRRRDRQASRSACWTHLPRAGAQEFCEVAVKYSCHSTHSHVDSW